MGTPQEKEFLFNIQQEINSLFIENLNDFDKEFLITFLIGGFLHVNENYLAFSKGYNYKEINDKSKVLIGQILATQKN